MTEIDRLGTHLETIAVDAARGVGDRLRAAFAETQEPAYKQDFHDIVTRHDRETEEVLRDGLLRAHPDSTVHGEEHGRYGDGAVEWYVDPIDGTSNFALGLPYFAVSIGAVAEDQLVAGVVYDVMRDTVYSASARGAYQNGREMRSSGPATDAESMLFSSFPDATTLHDPDRAAAGHATHATLLHEFGAVRRLGSTALALAYVAAGAGVAHAAGIHPWDVAAGWLLVTRAGGRYLPLPDTAGHKARPWLAPGYLATNGGFDLSRSCLAGLLPTMSPVD